MSTKVDELKLDINELNALLQRAVRPKNKALITLEIARLQTELSQLNVSTGDNAPTKRTDKTSSTQKYYEVKMNNYGWDQTNTTAKIYVTCKNVHQLPKESVVCKFTDRSFDLHILGLENRNYNLSINNLAETIIPEKSYVKIKTNMVVVCLAKEQEMNWSHITSLEKRLKESKASSISEDADDSDPGANLVNLVMKMYQDGDDDMKRTIAKAWTEEIQKNAANTS